MEVDAQLQKDFDLMHEIYAEMNRRKVEAKTAFDEGKSDEELNLLMDKLTNETYEKFYDRLPEGIREDQTLFMTQIALMPEEVRPRTIIKVRETFLATTYSLCVEFMERGMKPTTVN